MSKTTKNDGIDFKRWLDLLHISASNNRKLNIICDQIKSMFNDVNMKIYFDKNFTVEQAIQDEIDFWRSAPN